MRIQIWLGGKLLVAFDARKFFVGMNLHIVLFEQFERFKIFSLRAFSYMIFTLHHRTVECRFDCGSIWFFKCDIVSHKYVRHSMNTSNVLV